MSSGIYSIDNTENGWIYLGRAADIKKRWQQHVADLKRGHHPNRNLQAAWDMFGAKAFKFSIMNIVQLKN